MTDRGLHLLRTTFAVNAISSGLTGVLLLLGAVPLAPLLGLPGPLPVALFGASLFAFAAYVWRARREPLDLGQATAIFVLDVAYVGASVVVLLVWPGVLSSLGRVFVALMADVVAVFAILEYVGLRRARRSDAPVAARA
jgi:hypothetical protein